MLRIPCIAFACCIIIATAAAQEYHVATSGNDGNTGTTAERAFRSIQRAASLMVAGDVCTVHSGTYRESVQPARSGTQHAPIVFRAAAGATVTITGTDPITGWTRHSGEIWKARMAGDFFSRATPGAGSNLYDPAVFNQADQVFWNGAMAPVARWPNAAWPYDPSRPVKATTERFVSKSRSDNWTTGVVEDDHNGLAATACVGAEIGFQPSEHGWSWAFSGHVTAKSGSRLTFRTRSQSGKDFHQSVYDGRSRYWLFNHYALIDAPGEWYHDKANGWLYLRSPDGSSPEGKVTAKRRVWAFDLSDRSYITISDIDIHGSSITTDRSSGGDNIGYDANGNPRHPWRNSAYGRSTSPYHNPPYNDASSTGCVLERLNVTYPTHYTDISGDFICQWGQSSGVVLSGHRHVIRHCRIRFSAGNGIVALGREHRVLHNLIEDVDYGLTDAGFIHTGVTDRGSSDTEIAYNTCRRAARSGIMPRNLYNSQPQDAANAWRARIHHNDVSEFGIQDGDVGAIYTAGDHRFLRIDHNWLHTARAVDDRSSAGNFTAGGVYLDYGRNGIVHHNLIWGVEWGIHLQNQDGSAANHLVYNNSVAVVGLSDPDPLYGPFGIVKNASGSNQSGTVLRNNLVFCADGARRFQATDITDGSGRIVVDNLFWDGVAGSATDPRLRGGAWPQGAEATSDSSALIDRGNTIGSYWRDSVNVPGFNDLVSGSRPDIGALERGRPVWTAGSELVAPPAPTPTPPAPAALPTPWQTTVIGTATAGSASYSDGSFSVVGSGADIWNHSDGMRFVHREFSGDLRLTARVEAFSAPNAWGKAGIMLRVGTAADARNLFACVSRDFGVRLQQRSTIGGSTAGSGGSASAAPRWLRLERRGGRVSAFESADGRTWSSIGVIDIDLPPTLQVGVAVTSHSDGLTAEARFSAVTVEVLDTPQIAAPPAQEWSSGDIGAVAAVGSTAIDGDRVTIHASGGDIWNHSDEFRFVHQTLVGDGSITARVVSFSGPNAWGKAGVMLREGLGANARHALCAVTIANGVAFQRRSSVGGSSSHTAGSRSAAPRWVRLVRNGSTIRAYESADGNVWVLVGQVSIGFGPELQVGLAVTSHADGNLATAVFESITIQPAGDG